MDLLMKNTQVDLEGAANPRTHNGSSVSLPAKIEFTPYEENGCTG